MGSSKVTSTAKRDVKAGKVDLVVSKSRFEELMGFKLEDLSSWGSFVKLLSRPTDPSGLGVFRLVFGVLMMIDIWQERGMGRIVEEYGFVDHCRFPLFNSLKPLPIVWMYVVYLVLFIGELGITLGLFYRASCLLYISSYWYIFFLNKWTWNNHSYLFGLLGIILLLVDGNSYWSLDGLLFKKKRHTHVPLWNYALLRFQIFIVYFIAGLKKLDMDWMTGYSMHKIAGHFVFAPFRLILSEEQVSLFIVHLGGLTIDLSMGYLLFFDKTRPLAFLMGGSFHLMNSQLFSIGMFPWAMLATMSLFCYPDWPNYWFKNMPSYLSVILPTNMPFKTSQHCLYKKEDVKPESKQSPSADQGRSPPPTQPKRYHRVMTVVLICYVSIQCFLPYSHRITKGYNHWTQGLYGYSWDMMVHTWDLQHIKVSYIDRNTGEEGYLNPKAWTESARWSSHPDMVKQYAECVRERLASYNITDIEIYIDVWKALNDRFQQRSLDPRVNILKAPWSPFTQTSWLLPLLVDLSDWRVKLAEIEKSVLGNDDYTDVVFVADFPDLTLENFVQEDLGNTSVSVLEGEVIVELVDQHKNITLTTGGKLQLPVAEFHNIHTVSEVPSCYMYIFVNTTEVAFKETINKYDMILNGTFAGSDKEALAIKGQVEEGPQKSLFKDHLLQRDKKREENEMSLLQQFRAFVIGKYGMLDRTIKFTVAAVNSIVTGASFEDFVNKTVSEEKVSTHSTYTDSS